VADDFSAIASIRQLHDPLEAWTLHKRALELYTEIGHRQGQIGTLIDVAILARDRGLFEEAEVLLGQALGLAEGIGDPHKVYDIFVNRGDVRYVAGRLLKAGEDYLAACEVMESVRAGILLEGEALGYFDEEHLDAYPRLITVYVSLGDTREALLWIERAKARELQRGLRFGRLVVRDLPLELAQQESEKLMRLKTAAARLVVAEERLDAVRSCELLIRELHTLWSQMERFNAEYVRLRREEPLSWEELKQVLQ